MFDNIKEFFRTIFRSRLLVAATVMVLLFSVLIFRMFQLQIIKGAEYQDNYTLKIVRERTLNSTRGNILDRNGEVLAYNELAYSITIEDNGCGIEPAKVVWLRNTLGTNLNRKGIGISNIYQRLKLFYEDDVKFEIESKVGEGTRITIIIPDSVKEAGKGHA